MKIGQSEFMIKLGQILFTIFLTIWVLVALILISKENFFFYFFTTILLFSFFILSLKVRSLKYENGHLILTNLFKKDISDIKQFVKFDSFLIFYYKIQFSNGITFWISPSSDETFPQMFGSVTGDFSAKKIFIQTINEKLEKLKNEVN